MNQFQDLYQDLILDHNKSPRNYHKMEDADREVEGQNPLCGDHYTVYVKLEKDRIADVSFDGSGCAISKASASVMTSVLKGKTVEDAEHLFHLFKAVVTGELDPSEHLDELGKLAAFSGVAEFPMRVKCATLAWHTLHTALMKKDSKTSTK